MTCRKFQNLFLSFYLIFLSLCTMPQSIHAFTNYYKYNVHLPLATERIGKQVAKEHGMRFLLSNLPHVVGRENEFGWGFVFNDSRKMKIEQIKPLLVPITNELLKQMSADPLFNEYLEFTWRDQSSSYHSTFKEVPKVCHRFLAFKIAFWDENVERPPAPYLSEVRVYHDVVEYYTANPKDQSLQLILKEPYSSLLEPKLQNNP